MTKEKAQRAPTWDKINKALIYRPNLGGNGNDNEYYVTVKAVDGGIREVLGETEVPLGKY